jgi:hypothetical protein
MPPKPLLPFGAEPPASRDAMVLTRAPMTPGALPQRPAMTAVLLTIVTCGVYGLYWLARALRELKDATGDAAIAPLRATLLSALSFGLYAHIYLRARNNQLRLMTGEGENVNLPLWWALVPLLGILQLIYWFQERLNTVAMFTASAHGTAHAEQGKPYLDNG